MIGNTRSSQGVVRAALINYLTQPGAIQNYIEFISCEIDPLFSRQRTAVDVVDIKTETKNTKTLTLRPYREWGGFIPGQYIALEVEVDGVRLKRNYSISSSEAFFRDTGCINITVKHIDGGRVSGYVNTSVQKRDVLHIGPAAGNFTITKVNRDDDSLSELAPLFIAAGSGITPILSMIESIKEYNSVLDFTLIYHVLTKDEVVFEKRLVALASSLPNFTFIPHYTDQEGFVCAKQLVKDCNDITTRDIFLCGPPGFMDAVATSASELSVDPARITQESFGSGLPISKQGKNAVVEGTIHFLKSGKQLTSKGDKTLLELAELAGLNPKFGCRNGICFECKCQRGEGQVINTLTGELISPEQNQIQACISIPVGDISILDL